MLVVRWLAAMSYSDSGSVAMSSPWQRLLRVSCVKEPPGSFLRSSGSPDENRFVNSQRNSDDEPRCTP